MLNSFFVSNFRLFKCLELPKLRRINLVVGQNNTGKSALLEAINLYANNASSEALIDLIRLRNEFGKSISGQRKNDIHSVRHLFHGRSLPEFDGDGIRIGVSEKKENHLHLTKAAYIREETENGFGFKRIKVEDITYDFESVRSTLIVEDNDQTYRRIELDGDEQRRIRLTSYNEQGRYLIQTVRTQMVNMNNLASLWDGITLTDLENEVIEGIRLLEPQVQGLTFIEDISAKPRINRIPMIKHKFIKEPLPLTSMGDGIIRLFHIILALVNASGGILLIDELENGFHWKIHPKVWNVIFRLAKKLDVQVFATTHSSDCIRGYESVWKDNLESGTFFRLDVKEDKIDATYYDHETLYDAIVADVEVR